MTPAPLTFADLLPLLERGDPGKVAAAFAGRSEAERRAVAPEVWRWCNGDQRRWEDLETFVTRMAAALPAILACATLTELRKLPVADLHLDDVAFRVLAERRPRWVGPFVDVLLNQGPGMPWSFCRRLIRAGLCPTPAVDAYVLGLVGCGASADGLKEWLLQDPGLLEDEVWRLFEVEGRARTYSLTRCGDGWSAALSDLAADGVLSRDRLLDATLDALARDFAPYHARWFPSFHDRMAPTVEEQVARLDRYLHLLGSSAPLTVSFAIDVLEGLEAKGALPADDYARAAELAVSAGLKKTALAALRLLDTVGRGNPTARTAVAATAVVALGHPHREVQRAAIRMWKAAGAAGDVELRGRLLDAAPSVSPTLRRELEVLVGMPGAPAGRGDVTGHAGEDLVALQGRAARLPEAVRRLAGIDEAVAAVERRGLPPPVAFARHEVVALTPATAIVPIRDLTELLEVLTALIEAEPSGDDTERALDGLSRLCAQDLAGRPASPLRKRVSRLLGDPPARWLPPGCGDPRTDLCHVIALWLGVEVEDAPEPTSGAEWFLSRRALQVGERAARGAAAPLLAAPTHRGGWIDPAAVAPRLRALEGLRSAPTTADAYQAILRLGPCSDDAVLGELGAVGGPLADAFRAALGATAVAPPGPPLGRVARQRRSWGPLDFENQDYPTAPAQWHADRLSTRAMRWVATICPWATEPLLKIGGADVGARLELLRDPDFPCGPAGIRLLAIALSSGAVELRRLAVDTLTALVGDGRLNPGELGRDLHGLLGRGSVTAPPLALALAEAARTSTLHAVAVFTVIEGLLTGEATTAPPKLHHLLQVLLDLAIDLGTGVTSPGAWAYLAALKSVSPSSAAGRLARQVLAQADDSGEARRLAAVGGLRGRVERAERWAAAGLSG